MLVVVLVAFVDWLAEQLVAVVAQVLKLPFVYFVAALVEAGRVSPGPVAAAVLAQAATAIAVQISSGGTYSKTFLNLEIVRAGLVTFDLLNNAQTLA